VEGKLEVVEVFPRRDLADYLKASSRNEAVRRGPEEGSRLDFLSLSGYGRSVSEKVTDWGTETRNILTKRGGASNNGFCCLR
jgi:hypothetical protein